MKIIDLISGEKPSLSFEVFPPKNSTNYDNIKRATGAIAQLKPSFMSVTYGAGGTNAGYAFELADTLQNSYGVTPLAHLTCFSDSRDYYADYLNRLKLAGIENIMALRGDQPKDESMFKCFDYASDLVTFIKQHGDFCIGGACYPEGHIESETQKEDIQNLKIKVDAGCEFLTTQMFFDNNILYNFMYKIREAGINVPIVAGIMPVTNAKQIIRSCQLSGTYLPARFRQIIDRYGDNSEAMKQAGIAYATEQIVDLYANGINAVHVYSMNKPDIAQMIQSNLSAII